MENPQNAPSLGTGAIAGIAVGAAAGALLIAAIVWFLWHRRQKSAAHLKAPWPPVEVDPLQYHGRTDNKRQMAEQFSGYPPQAMYKGSGRSELAAGRADPSELSAERM